MKRVWAAVVMTCVVFALCAIDLVTTNKMTEKLRDSLLQAQACVQRQQMDEAAQYTLTTTQDWEKYHKILSMFLIHDRLEQIDQSLAVLQTNLERENYDDFLSEVSRTAAQLEHIKDTELPTIQNIL